MRLISGKIIVMAAMLAMLLSSIFATGANSQEESPETWTFMVYMSGDSDMSAQIDQDIQEMKRVGSGDGLEIIVLMDSSGIGDSSLLRILPDGMEDISLTSINASWGNELNMGNPEMLRQFVIWTAESYPSDRLMLDLWGHGRGWSGVCPDKGDHLDSAELRYAMKGISDAGVHLDIISIDACQMGMLETAYELRWAADYALLSQKDVPLSGWPYDIFLGHLKGDGNVAEKASKMIDSYISWGPGNSLYSLTLSLTNLSEMDGLAEALDSYSREAADMVEFFNPELIGARSLTESYDGNYQYDLAHLLQNINSGTRCKSLEMGSKKVLEALGRAIVHRGSWTNVLDEPADNANGLSLWFPNYAPTADYLRTGIAQDTYWPQFIGKLAPFFGAPGRRDVSHIVNAVSLDSNMDGLLDTISISGQDPVSGVPSFEVYGPDGSLFSEGTLSYLANESIGIPLENLGAYQAAIYLRAHNGTLLNYSFFESLVREGMSVISGRVTSNIGRGLKWVSISLLDSGGRIIDSTVTDRTGSYRLEIVIPTDTNGTGLVLVCGLGERQVNATVGLLDEENIFDFNLDTANDYVPFMIAGTTLILALGGIILVIWVIQTLKEDKSPDQNVLSQPPIPPQCDSTPTSTSTGDTQPPQAPT